MTTTARKPTATIDLRGTSCSGCGWPAKTLFMYPDVHVVTHTTGHVPCQFPQVPRGRTPGVAS